MFNVESNKTFLLWGYFSLPQSDALLASKSNSINNNDAFIWTIAAWWSWSRSTLNRLVIWRIVPFPTNCGQSQEVVNKMHDCFNSGSSFYFRCLLLHVWSLNKEGLCSLKPMLTVVENKMGNPLKLIPNLKFFFFFDKRLKDLFQVPFIEFISWLITSVIYVSLNFIIILIVNFQINHNNWWNWSGQSLSKHRSCYKSKENQSCFVETPWPGKGDFNIIFFLIIILNGYVWKCESEELTIQKLKRNQNDLLQYHLTRLGPW